MSTTVLVTGATGWLGGHILAALATRPNVTTIAACRNPVRLPDGFDGETRVGDLTDPDYRRDVVQGVDVVLHAGTWSSFWGHRKAERELFLEPSLDLIDQAAAAGVSRFVAASTVALGTPAAAKKRVSDTDAPVKRGFWPHLDFMIDVEEHMRATAGTMGMVSLRLGHFVGAGNSLGLVSAIVPRLATRMVPWVGGGRAHLPLVSGADMGEAFAQAATVQELEAFEAIAIIGPEQPTARDVFSFVAERAGVPKPMYSVPLGAAFAFAWLMEVLHPALPGKAPFLTRALVHVGQNWHMEATAAAAKLGYQPRDHWQDAALASIEERRELGFPWPALAQPLHKAIEQPV
jgi:nucleoside-diphosphate-sugar epimerase